MGGTVNGCIRVGVMIEWVRLVFDRAQWWDVGGGGFGEESVCIKWLEIGEEPIECQWG